MNNWLCTFEDGSEVVVEQPDLVSAQAYAAEHALQEDTSILSVGLIGASDEALASGLAKLVALGLTQNEALAVAGTPTPEAAPEPPEELPPVEQ